MLSFETSIIYGDIERNIRHRVDEQRAESDKPRLSTMANYDGIGNGGRHFDGAFFLFLPKERYW